MLQIAILGFGVVGSGTAEVLEENKKLNVNYSLDMCPKTLDILATTVYFNIDPNADEERVNAQIKMIREAAEAAK